MLAMIGHPGQRRAFARQPAEERQQPADRPIGFEAAVRQAAVVTHAHAHEPVSKIKPAQTSSACQLK